MSSEKMKAWVSYVKEIQNELHISYKEALKEASRRKKQHGEGIKEEYKKVKNIIDNRYQYPPPTKSASGEQEGEGIFSEIGRHIKGLFMSIKGYRTNLKPSARKVIEENAENYITTLKIIRRPLRSEFKAMVKYVGSKEELKKNHDTLFHLLIVVKLDNGNEIKIEKNQDINIEKFVPALIDESLNVQLNKKLTIMELLETTRKNVGDVVFFNYDAFSTNCQRFVKNVIDANQLNNDTNIHSFVMQDVSKLVPSFTKKLAHILTDGYNRGLTAVHGEGKN